MEENHEWKSCLAVSDLLEGAAARLIVLETALRKIDKHLDNLGYSPTMKARKIARAALAPEPEK